MRRWLVSASSSRWLAFIFLVALTLRMIVVFASFHVVAANVDHHSQFGWEMGWTARSIASGLGFSSPFIRITGPTALVPPLYPYLLASIFHVFGIYSAHSALCALSLNAVFSSLTSIPLFFLARNALNLRSARIASAAWAIYPFAIYFSAARVWDYALTSLLFTCCLVLAQRLHLRGVLAWISFGLLFGLTGLSNPSILSLFPFLLMIAAFKLHRVNGRWFGRSLLACVALLCVCAPWAIRCQRALHAGFLLRDGFWLEFYAGNNGDTFNTNPGWAHPASNPAEMQKYIAQGEIAYMAEKHALGADWVSQHKLDFGVLCIRRFGRFWFGFWSLAPRYLADEPLDLPNIPFCLFLAVMMVRGLVRWWRDDPSSVLPYLLACIVLPIPYYLTHSSADYRQPIEPVILLLVTVGLFGTSSSRAPAFHQETGSFPEAITA